MWQKYPYSLVPGDLMLDFPAAEGTHPDFQSDTWYLAGHLTGASGRTYAFITIFNRNRPGGGIVADFYTLSLFDTSDGRYGTYTDYDMPPKNMTPSAVPKLTSAEGSLDLRYDSSAGVTTWTTCGEPFTYDFAAVGIDSASAAMELTLQLTCTRPPVPVGASAYNGKITACLQKDTYSYFQTGVQMTGTLRWGDVVEEVSGPSGHIDRQWFPAYAGGGGSGGDPRGQAHEWHTITLDNGADLSVWRQYDRRDGNVLVPFLGITACYDDGRAPECVEDLEVTTTGYVRWPDEVRSLMRPPAVARYLPQRHVLRSALLDLELFGEPLVHAPGHALPIEYMEGPQRYTGVMRGVPVTGLALYEATNTMYRDWELIDVLATQIGAPSAELDEARRLIAAQDDEATLAHLEGMRPVLDADALAVLDDLIEAVRGQVR